MHWYGGSIAEAVTLSKQKNAIFVVFVEGDNNLSTEMAATIDDATVVSRLSNETNFLAVKLKSGTVNYTHFAQIYQFVPVPSLFFIGRNGTPLEVVCAGVQPDNLASRIDRILAEHHKEKPPIQPSTSSQNVTSPQNVKEQTTSLLQSEATAGAKEVEAPKPAENAPQRKDEAEPTPPPAKIAKSENAPSPDSEVVCDGDVCVRRPKESGASTSAQEPAVADPAAPNAPSVDVPKPGPSAEVTTSTGSIEDKMDRAKELIEARRREKAEKEKELERQKELERRNNGQGVAELKKWQTEQELKQIQEERKREKMENNLARQRILEQIAQDRAERKARDTNTQPQPAATAPQATPPANPTSGDAQNSARIQFKLPDGTSHSASFDASGTLGQVQRYVADNLQLSSSSFSLWTAFPRRELTEVDSTLRDLQLAPSAALLVLRRNHATAPPDSSFSVLSFITQLLTSLIYEPTLQVYTWLRSRLFPPPAVSPSAPSPPSPPQPRPPTAATLRRRGNIHRLPGDAPDDDNNTWNGNSTQQM